jgi:hypothetical protein
VGSGYALGPVGRCVTGGVGSDPAGAGWAIALRRVARRAMPRDVPGIRELAGNAARRRLPPIQVAGLLGSGRRKGNPRRPVTAMPMPPMLTLSCPLWPRGRTPSGSGRIAGRPAPRGVLLRSTALSCWIHHSAALPRSLEIPSRVSGKFVTCSCVKRCLFSGPFLVLGLVRGAFFSGATWVEGLSAAVAGSSWRVIANQFRWAGSNRSYCCPPGVQGPIRR